jgi:hypothetical protein
VFHVTTSSSGSVKWTQVSEDLVPVNITCLQPPAAAAAQTDGDAGSAANQQQIVFHITAYNSQVEKILDVRLIQPGKTRSESRLKESGFHKSFLDGGCVRVVVSRQQYR